MAPTKDILQKLLEPADIRVGGDRPWDLRVNNDRFYSRLLTQGSLGAGESYMDGDWETDSLDQLLEKLFRAVNAGLIKPDVNIASKFVSAKFGSLFLKQSKEKDMAAAASHYNTDPELFGLMLGRTMAYSCGYWKAAKNIDEAEEAKFELICRKLKLQKGMRVLDIGCGWGTLAAYMAKNYGVSVVGVTVSKDQYEGALKLTSGLDVKILLQDFRDIDTSKPFDAIASVGMFEHIRVENYRIYMEIARKALKEDGLFLLHTIGCLVTKREVDPWIQKYIFPHAMLPSLKQIEEATEKLFVTEDVQNFGAYYDPTLMAWWDNFDKSWPTIKHKFGDDADRFYRMWEFYLKSCAGAFRARNLQLYQLVLSPRGVDGVYEGVR
jgi:cyclopropane-fatty-acyl-phospholipid synthase